MTVHFVPVLAQPSDDDDQQWSYNSVRRLTYKANLSEWSTLSHTQFIKIQELCVYLPFNDYFWPIVPKFDRLTLLDVLSNDYNENYQIQLQTLLNRAPHVFVLCLRNWSSTVSQILPVRKLSQLDLMWCNKWYRMNNHQALNVRCQNDTWNNRSISIEDELVRWLRQNLPSLWTITRDYYPVCSIRLWIH